MFFAQEENFYYLTGHNEEEAGVILLPPADNKAKKDDFEGPREILFLIPAKNPAKEKWNGVRMSPSDPGIQARTGFADVRPFSEMRATIERLTEFYPTFYTILPFEKELGGYPHERETVEWLKLAAPPNEFEGHSRQHRRLAVDQGADGNWVTPPGYRTFAGRALCRLQNDAGLGFGSIRCREDGGGARYGRLRG